MRFYGHFSTSDIDEITWFEAEQFYAFYCKAEDEKEKIRAAHIMNSTRIAYHGKDEDVRRYIKDLFKEENQANDIDKQFEGVNFG